MQQRLMYLEKLRLLKELLSSHKGKIESNYLHHTILVQKAK